MTWSGLSFVLIFSLIIYNVVSQATANSALPCPIPVSIGNVTLPSTKVIRGMRISVGSPPQPLSFLPQRLINASFIYGPQCRERDLNNSSPEFCNTVRGGQYDQLKSSSSRFPNELIPPNESMPHLRFDTASDTFKLNDNLSLESQIFGIPRAGIYSTVVLKKPMNAIGLGMNSSLLNSLYNSGRIISRTWSMFYGYTGLTSDDEMDGIFVFGGYDRAKVSGEPSTKAFDGLAGRCNSRMSVNITKLTLNFSNGTDASLIDGDQPKGFMVCVDPTFPGLLQLPGRQLDRFLNSTGIRFNDSNSTGNNDIFRSRGIDVDTMVYEDVSKEYTGDLTITFNTKFSVRIPNKLLSLPYKVITPSGDMVVEKPSRANLLFGVPYEPYSADLNPWLGYRFLSVAHLLVNNDAETFTFWRANPVTEQELVAVDASNNNVPVACETADGGDGAIPSESPSRALRGGAIAGTVIGCVAGISIVVIGALFLWKGMRERGKETLVAKQTLGPNEKGNEEEIGELPDRSNLLEMDVERDHVELGDETTSSLHVEGNERKPPAELP